MQRNDELLAQISDIHSLSNISGDGETTEATNNQTVISDPNIQKPKNYLRTGSLFDEIVCLRNIDQLELFDDTNEDLTAFSSSKKRNLSLDYNPTFINGFTIQDEKKCSPATNRRRIQEENKIKAHNAYEDFFLLTCQSVKLNFKYMDEILDVDIRPFFKEVLENRIPFHKVLFFQ